MNLDEIERRWRFRHRVHSIHFRVLRPPISFSIFSAVGLWQWRHWYMKNADTCFPNVLSDHELSELRDLRDLQRAWKHGSYFSSKGITKW